MNRDIEHLRILAIFHYVFAALATLGSLLAGVYIVLGVAFITGTFNDGSANEPPPELGWMLLIMGTFGLLLGLGISACIAIAGRKLWTRRGGYTFCLVVAAFECLSVPLGTILGVFTLIVLMRPTVRPLFEGRFPAPPGQAEPPVPASMALPSKMPAAAARNPFTETP